jgi:hypothetical protein
MARNVVRCALPENTADAAPHLMRFRRALPRLNSIDDQPLSRWRSHSAVAGSMTARTVEIVLAGNPPFWACSRTSFSLSAI